MTDDKILAVAYAAGLLTDYGVWNANEHRVAHFARMMIEHGRTTERAEIADMFQDMGMGITVNQIRARGDVNV